MVKKAPVKKTGSTKIDRTRRRRGKSQNDQTGETETAAAYKESTQSALMRETAKRYMQEEALPTSNLSTPPAPVNLPCSTTPFEFTHSPDSVTSSEVHSDDLSDSDSLGAADIVTTPPLFTRNSTASVITDSNRSSNVNVRAGPSPSLAVSSLHSNDSDVDHLQQQVKILEKRNKMLRLQVSSVTSVGAADPFQVLQIRKMVKEDLFKKVKFINKPSLELAYMRYLSNKFSIKQEDERDWMATYAPYAKDVLNNKRNNVSQDLKKAVKGKHFEWPRISIPECIKSFNTHVCSLALLCNPDYSHKRCQDFENVRGSPHTTGENMNLFFDYLVPCTAGRKFYTDRDKVAATISDGGKVNVTDEAFTELMILNYWEKWQNHDHAQWTNARGGNTQYKGWPLAAYLAYDTICRRIKRQRELDPTLHDSKERAFVVYAQKKYGTSGQANNRKRIRGDANEGIDMYNELDV